MLDYNASLHLLFWFSVLEWEYGRLPLYFYSKSQVLQSLLEAALFMGRDEWEREREGKPQTPLHHYMYSPMAARPNKICLTIPRSICLATILGKSGGRRGCTVTGPLATNLNHKNAATQGLL